jgi:CRISPR-associated protein Cas2
VGRCLVVYDIPNDRIRTRVAGLCLDYGLSRIQYSAFLGDLARSHQDELLHQLRRHLGKAACRVVLLPVCDTDFRTRRELEQA